MTSPAKREQRLVLVGLIGLALAGLLRPLLVPRQPPLPRLRTDLTMDGAWRVDDHQPRTPSRRLHPPWRSVAMGPTYRLVHASGQVLLLTPLASWDANVLTETCVSGDGNSKTKADSDDRERSASAHTCLTRHQKVAHREEELAGLLQQRDPRFFSQPFPNLMALVLPIRPRYSTAVLLTAEGEIDSEAIWKSRAFVEGLSDAIIWPGQARKQP